MASLRRSLTVAAPVGRVAAYLSDYRNSAEWDPHTVSCRALGEEQIAVGTRYEHVRELAGFRATVEYRVVDYVAGERVAWRGENDLADGEEEFLFEATAEGGTTVTHRIDITLHGVAARFGERMLPRVLRRIADDGTPAFRDRLERLA